MIKTQYLILSIFSFLIAFVFVPFFDLDIPVIAEGVGDNVGIIGYGAFNTEIELSDVQEPQPYYQSSVWNYVSGTDYLAFRDSTTDSGFRLRTYMSSTANGWFVYSGNSASQTDVDVSNFKIWANYISQTYSSATKAVDDISANLNILSANSCAEAQSLTNYNFNPAFLSLTTQYGLIMSSTQQDILTSDLGCEVEGQIKIKRMELNYPPDSNSGTYSSNIIILIIDGNP